MPQLGKKHVSQLLRTVSGRRTQSTPPKETRKPQPVVEIDTDAEPQSSSEDEVDELSPTQNGWSTNQLQSAASSKTKTKLEDVDFKSESKSVTLRSASSGGSLEPLPISEWSGKLSELKKGSSPDSTKINEKRRECFDAANSRGSFFPDDSEPEKPRKKRIQNTYKRGRAGTTSNLHTVEKKEDATVKTKQKAQFKTLPVNSTSPLSNGKASFTAPKSPPRSSKRLRNGRAFATPPQSLSSLRSSKRAFQKTGSNISSTQDIDSDGEGPIASSTAQELNDMLHSQLGTTEFLNSPPASREGSPSNIDVTRCPLCKAVVDSEFLEEHPDARALRLQAAMDFCAAHKQHSARRLWANSKYPKIEWDNLDVRLNKLDDQLRAILKRQSTSAFRQEVEKKVASGRNRNDLRQVKGEVSQSSKSLYGYYGTKGARKMMEHITYALASELRTSSAEDALFTEVGVPGFVQTVLVPELVQLLVMDDFGCDRTEAKEIIERSAEMGVLVNEEEEEQIQEVADADANV